MTKILILPFLQMPSGHHQAADTLSYCFKEIDRTIEVRKIDIFHYTSRIAESISTNIYLKALKLSPSFYSWLYRQNACKNYEEEKRYLLYEFMFLGSMKRLINAEDPDLIICTHCLPSYLLNVLKQQHHFPIPVINAYTDFFINSVWGLRNIDLHFAGSNTIKQFLERNGVPQSKIVVTGIPVHPKITDKKKITENKNKKLFNVLVAGGNLGVGQIGNIVKQLGHAPELNYYVLCGKNNKLFWKIEKLQNPRIIPVSYIADREEMNELYDRIDAALTKPGGITVSECLRKEIPLFLLESLPGPEEQNEKFLLEEKLAMKAPIAGIEEAVLSFLTSEKDLKEFHIQLSSYSRRIENLDAVLKRFF
ncbi:UDP-glucuronosyltransferase [Bacillus sp. ISL-39]|uniref:MGDG synthase family glycosyltransferase n=1 Tax=Bacillus sp. ISL-39 TaxID=2819124 RepID=UPI001BE670CC|nr:UDP-glucuronosyltransferase [Bacillus sp. ISL-39]MBT2638022.1 UDP-glucuronosyltransferase [Bacillus sp. ISL-39]